MDINEFEAPNTGYDMWRDYKSSYGLIRARIICNEYLAMQERSMADNAEEMQFCQELRDAMTAERNFTDVVVYNYSRRLADFRGELDLYNASTDTNRRCAEDIDRAIHAVEYGDGTHAFDRALAALVQQYGMERVRCVLGAEAKWHGFMGHLPIETYQWAQGLKLHEDFHSDYHLRSRPEIFVGLITELQKEDAKIPMDIRNRNEKAIISDCIEGLGVYAALCVHDNSFTTKPDDIRKLISNLVPYWGLDDGHGAKSVDDFLQDFEDTVEPARLGGEIHADTYEACADILNGLHLYGKELVVAQGSDAMGEILQMSDLIKEVSGYFGYETDVTHEMAVELVGEVRAMLAGYNFPGKALEGDNVRNYAVQRAVMFDNNRGFAFAHNPNAASPYVTWQFTNEDGKLNYYWGKYYGSEEAALVNYIKRAADYVKQYKVMEKPLPKTVAVVSETSTNTTIPEVSLSETTEPKTLAVEQPEVKQLIRFIDSDYKELFQIPDGESIRITYPPGDGREPEERSCKFHSYG